MSTQRNQSYRSRNFQEISDLTKVFCPLPNFQMYEIKFFYCFLYGIGFFYHKGDAQYKQKHLCICVCNFLQNGQLID